MGMYESVSVRCASSNPIADGVTQALLTLNSCPMFTYNERDLHRMPPPAKTHLPVKQFIADTGIVDDEDSKEGADVRRHSLLSSPDPIYSKPQMLH